MNLASLKLFRKRKKLCIYGPKGVNRSDGLDYPKPIFSLSCPSIMLTLLPLTHLHSRMQPVSLPLLRPDPPRSPLHHSGPLHTHRAPLPLTRRAPMSAPSPSSRLRFSALWASPLRSSPLPVDHLAPHLSLAGHSPTPARTVPLLEAAHVRITLGQLRGSEFPAARTPSIAPAAS